jgi:4'-phosphopantetheinyl transferase
MPRVPRLLHNSARLSYFKSALPYPMPEICQGPSSPTPSPAIDLWLLSTEGVDAADLAQLKACLSPAEQAQLQRRRLPHIQQQFILSRGCLRYLLGQYTGRSPGSLRFSYGPQGKPALEFAAEDGIAPQFNLSHSGQRILIAVSGADWVGAIGIDIEAVRSVRYLPELCRRWFTPAEAQTILALSGYEADCHFLRYWTGKEACLKAMGLGIADSLQRLELTIPARDLGKDLTQIALSAPDLPHCPKQVYQWQPEPGYVAAVAVQATIQMKDQMKERLRLYQTSPQELVSGAAFTFPGK